jgi:tetratricopeptide (TPR) repeat protein
LVQAGILTPAQLQEAMRSSRSKKLQIGQVLVMSGYMTSRDLQIVLEAQSMLRDRTIDLNLAIQCIKVARKIGGNFSDVLEDYDQSAAQRARTGKLGELLSEAGLISEEDLSEAMERSVNTGMPLGRMLVLNRILPSEVLQKALEVQVRLRDEVISREEAILSLRQAAGLEGEPAEQAKPEEKKKPIVRLGELLVMAGILTETDVMDALEWGLANQQPIGVVLVSQELISKELLDAALFFQNAVRDNKIDAMKACELLSEVFSTGVSPEEALAEAAPEQRREEPEVPPITYQQLLTLSRVVTDEDIEGAFELKRHGAALIGKVLVLTGLMDVPTLQATLRCYQMVAKGWLNPDDAIATLDYCLHNGDNPTSFEQALRDLKWTPESGLKMRGEAATESSTTLPSVKSEPAEPVTKEASRKSLKDSLRKAKGEELPPAADNLEDEQQEPTSNEDLPAEDDDDEEEFVVQNILERTLAEEEAAAKAKAEPSKDDSEKAEAEKAAREKAAAEKAAAAKATAEKIAAERAEAEKAEAEKAEAEKAEAEKAEAERAAAERAAAEKAAAEKAAAEKEEAEAEAKKAELVAAKKQAEPASAKSKKGAKEAVPEPAENESPESKSGEDKQSESNSKTIESQGPTAAESNGDSVAVPPEESSAAKPTRKKMPLRDLDDDEEDANETRVMSSSEPSLARALNSLFDDGDDDDEPALAEEPLTSTHEAEEQEAEPSEEASSGGLKNLLKGLMSDPEEEEGEAAVERPAEKAEVFAGSTAAKKAAAAAAASGGGSSAEPLSAAAQKAEEIATDNEPVSNGEPAKTSSGSAELSEIEKAEAKLSEEAEPSANEEQTEELSASTSDEKSETVAKTDEPTEEEVAIEDIAKLSAEQLLVEIMKTAQNPEIKVTSKRGGRFSETILPEDAKARQLAKLVGKEASKELAERLSFDQSGENSEEIVDTAFGRLAETYFEQGNYKEAQVIYERMLVNRLNELGPDNPLLVEDYNNLAMTLCVQGRFDKAEPFMKRAVHLYETTATQDPVEFADYLHSLGTIEYKLEKHKEAEEIMLRVVSIRRESLDEDHEDIGRALADYAKVLKKLGKDESAEAIYKKAREILKKNREA